MSIILKGIDIPKDIDFVEITTYKNGIPQKTIGKGMDDAIQIDRPHGRLIDADLFKELIKDSVPAWTIGVKIPTYGDMDIMDKIYFIPTILEAEE